MQESGRQGGLEGGTSGERLGALGEVWQRLLGSGSARQRCFDDEAGRVSTKAWRRLSRWLCWGLTLCGVLGASTAQAQLEYISRIHTEVYLPVLLGDGFSSATPGEGQLWTLDYTRRQLALTYGEARTNRPLYVDANFEGSYPINMPGFGQNVDGRAIEFVPTSQPEDISLRVEAYAEGHLTKEWRLAFDGATRLHLLQDLMPAEFYARVLFSRSGFAGTNPLELSFFGGVDVRPADVAVGGLTLGGAGLLSTSRYSMTRLLLRGTWWGSADPFENLIRLELAQTYSILRRRLALNFSGALDLRKVRLEEYEADFGRLPDRTEYVDLVLQGGVEYIPWAPLRLGLLGRLVPFHTPDPRLIRWYRPVMPQLSLVAAGRAAVFDVSASYTFSLVPPTPEVGVTYEDSGTGVVPGSTPGHLFSLSLSLRI